MQAAKSVSNFRCLVGLAAVLAVIIVSSRSAVAATPDISSPRVQLRTQADGSVGVNVSITVEDSDGLDGLTVTVGRPGVFPRSFPLQRGLYTSPSDICTPSELIPLNCTRDSFSVTIGPGFIPEAQRAGDYVITVNDGGTQISTTVVLPAGLTALGVGGTTFVDPTSDFERPIVSIPPIPGASGYRIAIMNDSDSISRRVDRVSGPELNSSSSIRLGNTSRLQTGKFYRLSIEAFDGTTVASSNRRSESADICYDPATGSTTIPCFAQKDVHLVTRANGTVEMLAISRVMDSDDLAYLQNPPAGDDPVTVQRTGSFGPFSLKSSIYVDTDIDSAVTDRFTSSHNPYLLDTDIIPENQRAGDYTFMAKDFDNPPVEVTRNFPSGRTPLPVIESCPEIDQSSGIYNPTVRIPPVPGASNYRVVVRNLTDLTRKNFDDLPGSMLSEDPEIEIIENNVIEPNKFYSLQMDAFNNQTFSTTTVRSQSYSKLYDPSGLDSDGDWIQDAIDGQFAGGFVDESGTVSSNFTNQQLGGTVFGSIIDRADLDVAVVPTSNPDYPVNIAAACGSGTATVNACLPSVYMQLTERDQLDLVCGSLSVEVFEGPIEFLLGSDGILTAPASARFTIDETTPGSYAVVNLPTSVVPLSLVLNGEQITLQPGTPSVSLPEVVIKPGDGPNCVNPKSGGFVPVAILGGTTDVSVIVQSTLQLDDDSDATTQGISPAKIATNDVNGDGINDLILHFKTQALNSAGLISEGLTLFITGQLTDGASLVGSDAVYLSSGPTCN